MRGCAMRVYAGQVVTALCGMAALPAVAADWNVSGFIREEAAYKTTSDQNEANQAGIPTNGKAVANTGLGKAATPTLTRPASFKDENDWNMLATRLELSLDGKLSENFAAHFKLRGFTDQVGAIESAFHNRNLFEQNFGGSRAGTPGAIARKDWMLDLPVAYLDYSNGPFWLRAGNQQIAWGEAIFFRVADVPNGLDFRRHLVLDPAAEEYSDKRVPALGVRASYRAGEKTEIEGFVQKFQPSILPGDNAPYNFIPSQFTIHQREGYREVDNKWNFGARVRGDVAGIGMQAFAVHRHNPDGVYSWTEATGPGAVAGTPFQAATGEGVYSAQEWFSSASLARLDGVGGLDAALNEFVSKTALAGTASTVAGACGAASSASGAIVNTPGSASCVLDTFFDPAIGLGNLKGHLIRRFPSENIFGFGLNKVFEGEPDSWLDQLIGRFELSYTPNKKFTNPTLSTKLIERDETQFALIFEKYQKFSNSVPATYMVAQWLHKSASDLFGRALSGMDNVPGQHPRGQSGGFNAVALAFQQPSPTLAWRFDLTVLTDMKGGWLVQPGARWRPSKSLQLELYANVLESRDNGKDFAQGFKHANEVLLRGTLFF